jgi:hypothetical protein
VIHRFVNPKADGADATITQPSNWNDVHKYGFRSVSANATISVTDSVILATAGAGGITLTLPSASANSGAFFLVVRIDTAAGAVTITGTGLSYALNVAGDSVRVYSDGTNWQVERSLDVGGRGTALVDFGAFPGTSDASVVVTGQAGIQAASVVKAWILPAATSDHSADEHLLETLEVFAGNIVAGTGFTIYGVNFNPPSQIDNPFIYGKWNVGWEWV